jgi:hypothetical protein
MLCSSEKIPNASKSGKICHIMSLRLKIYTCMLKDTANADRTSYGECTPCLGCRANIDDRLHLPVDWIFQTFHQSRLCIDTPGVGLLGTTCYWRTHVDWEVVESIVAW